MGDNFFGGGSSQSQQIQPQQNQNSFKAYSNDQI